MESDSIWPSLSADDPNGNDAGVEVGIAPAPAEANPQPTLSGSPGNATDLGPPQLGTGNFAPQPLSTARPTGTVVGQKIQGLREELRRLQTQLGQQNLRLQQIRAVTTENAQRYHGTVAAVTARLQLGTTPGNPVLISQWNAAQAELDAVSNDIAEMSSLANEVAGDASLANFVLESARASYFLSGAIDEDHRQLAILEDETNRTVVLVDRLLNELNEDVARQTAYVGNERRGLMALSQSIKNGELYGGNLIARAYTGGLNQSAAAAPSSAFRSQYRVPSTPRSGYTVSGRQPLVIIRFDRPDVAYEQALYQALSQTLEGQPNAQFDLVAVSPGGGSPADVAVGQSKSKRFANQVLRSMTDMGLPANRIDLAAITDPATISNEVHIYAR